MEVGPGREPGREREEEEEGRGLGGWDFGGWVWLSYGAERRVGSWARTHTHTHKDVFKIEMYVSKIEQDVRTM